MLNRLEGALNLFKISNKKKIPFLLHYIGPAAFDVICNKCVPDDSYKQNYDALIAKLQNFYAPAPLEIAENFCF